MSRLSLIELEDRCRDNPAWAANVITHWRDLSDELLKQLNEANAKLEALREVMRRI